MTDSRNFKPGSRPGGGTTPPARTPAASDKSQPPADALPSGRSGRVVHDERGNAVWDWLKDTARIAIDSTSRLLKKLEVPELTMEDTQNNSLSLESDRDAGGGYDPYGSSARSKGGARRDAPYSTHNSRSAGKTNSNIGGGYDPYGKGVTRKPGR